MRFSWLLTLLVSGMVGSLLAIPTPRLAADEKKSDDKGDLPGPFHPYNITGDYAGKFHCLVCDNGLFPGALVFVRGADPSKEVQSLLTGLNDLAKKNEKARFEVFAVFLDSELSSSLTGDNKIDDRRDELTEKLRPLQKQLGLDHTVFALEAENNLKGFKLGEKDAVTVFLYSKVKIVDRFAFERIESKDVDAILAAASDKLVAKKK
ncbi:MAG: hypothetical protein ACJ8FY_21650 [Gemmataceae bacterium]